MRTYQDFKANRVLMRHHKELSGRKKLFLIQLLNTAVVVLAWGVVALVSWFYPGFFSYPYFSLSVEWSVLINFWPLLLWCFTLITMAKLFGGQAQSTHLDEQLFGWGLLTGNFAALWEEFGYRGAYICIAMLMIAGVNWLMGTVFIWILAVLFAIATFGALVGEGTSWWKVLLPATLAVSCYFLAGVVDPWYWIYESVVMPALNVLSFGSFSAIMDPAEHNQLFVMGGILANAWFRDGHKYQGWLGHLDSWLIGFVLLYAMMTYGLLTAVVLHALWNTTIHTTEYLRRKFFG